MKRLLYLSILVLIGLMPIVTGCGESKADKEARIEAARQDSIREAQRLEEERLEQERLELERREAEEKERLEQERLEEERKKTESANLPFSKQTHKDPYNTLVGKYEFTSTNNTRYILELTNEEGKSPDFNKCIIYRDDNPSQKLYGNWYKYGSMDQIEFIFNEYFRVNFPSGLNALIYPCLDSNYIYVCDSYRRKGNAGYKLPIRKFENNNYYSNGSNNIDMEIMLKLHELGEQGRAMMPQIEQLYRVQQQAQRNGILSNPEAQHNLRQALDQLLAIKDEQIKLARQLGDANLVREYQTQRDKLQESADIMLMGRSGRVQLPY